MAQLTPVEWLEETIRMIPTGRTATSRFQNKILEHIKNAKQIEKQTMINFANDICEKNINIANKIISKITKIEGELFIHDDKQAENFYNETFGK